MSVDFVMTQSLEQLLALLQSTNAQAQLITAMIGELTTDPPIHVHEKDGEVHLPEVPAPPAGDSAVPPEISALKQERQASDSDQTWGIRLDEVESARLDAIVQACPDTDPSELVSKLVAVGLERLELAAAEEI